VLLLFHVVADSKCSPHRSDSMVPWIATELSVGALVLILGVFWLTLDMTQQHEVTLMNYLDFVGTAQEKGYLVNMFDIGSKL